MWERNAGLALFALCLALLSQCWIVAGHGPPLRGRPVLDADARQIVEVRAIPRDDGMGDKDAVRRKRVTDALLKMVKLDIAALEKAYRS